MGNEIQQAKRERDRFGRFFYRFPRGESGLDVFNRTTSFIATVFRDCDQLRADGSMGNDYNVVIVTHGLTMRLFIMRWFQYTVEEFEQTKNPANASMIVMERQEDSDGRQYFELTEESRAAISMPKSLSNRHAAHAATESISNPNISM